MSYNLPINPNSVVDQVASSTTNMLATFSLFAALIIGIPLAFWLLEILIGYFFPNSRPDFLQYFDDEE